MTQWDAQKYERISALQQQMATEALALVHFRGSERVLDVGCGSGRITAEIARRLTEGEVVGVDASSDMIHFAEKAAAESGITNLRYAVRDARQLEFRQEFDAAVSFNALHWVPEQETALRSLHASLRPDSWAQLRLVPKSERKSLEDVLEETSHLSRWAKYFKRHADPYLHLTSDEYCTLATQCGFEIQQVHVSDKAWDFKSRDNFFRFGQVTFVAWTDSLPPEDRPDFIQDVLDRYRTVACSATSEENFFWFYQMDLRIAVRESLGNAP